MVSKRLFAGFAVLVFAIGLLVVGYDIYNKTQESPTVFQELDGLALYSTRSIKLNSYSLLLLTVDPINRSAIVDLYITFSTESSSLSIFGQSPCDLSSLELVSEESSSEPIIIKVDDKTYFQQEFKGESENYRIRYKFFWENYLSKVSYSKFRLVVPFNLGYLNEIEKTGIDVGSYIPITPDMANESSLSIRLPTDSTNIDAMPMPDNFTYYPENIWYIWDLKGRSDPKKVVSTAFLMEFESSSLIEQKENDIFRATVFIAAGCGGIFSAFIFFLGSSLKRSSKNSDKARKTPKRSHKLSET